MRTTVTLDPDTEQAVRSRMERDGLSFKQALNETIRDGLQRGGRPAPFVTGTWRMGTPAIDLDKALALAADLEDAELARAMRRGV